MFVPVIRCLLPEIIDRRRELTKEEVAILLLYELVSTKNHIRGRIFD